MKEKIQQLNKYCNSLTQYSRYKTREVYIGDIPLGGNNPIRIQSMTTTNTMDTNATVEQAIRIIEAGCDYVRITAPSINEAKNLLNIKNELRRRGYNTPLIADIHYTPNAAEIAARIVEKVRINPGNFVDKKKFQIIEYTDKQYEEELERIREKLIPLLKICKEYGTALRIGTNHGSLSDRILSRYGDTPNGMVESAMEFLRICIEEGFHSIVLSMKASNPQIMVQTYRLLINKMEEEGMNYPLHLGVTEAGFGEDGIIKSAVGIGTLLEDGLGDTIRVSLAEEPEYEIPVAKTLIKRYEIRTNHQSIIEIDKIPIDPFSYNRRETFEISNIGGKNGPKVVADLSEEDVSFTQMKNIGYQYSEVLDKWFLTDSAADIIYLGKQMLPFEVPQNLKVIVDYDKWSELNNNNNYYPFYSSIKEFLYASSFSNELNFIEININQVFSELFNKIQNNQNLVFVINTYNIHGMAEQRRILFEFVLKEIKNPVIIRRDYENITEEELMLHASTDLGALFIDGFGDGIWITAKNRNGNKINKSFINRLSFSILQAARVRSTKTEYIACPSCGRTLFDLVEVTTKIKEKTEHLKGVKIAIMGCIVNGPGEMADADYGYVGSGIGKVTLYKGKEIIKRNIPEENALDELIELIKKDGKWVEKREIL